MAFAAIDRPEDRPFTVPWLLTSLAATWAVMVAWIALLPAHLAHYMLIALFVSGVGDSLAEPVGRRFGRHPYAVRALGTNRMYTRTLEGSACIFLSAIVGALLISPLAGVRLMTGAEILLSLLLFPVVATLTEAKSPHTWDQPLIIAACGLTTGAIAWVQ
jgi:phytol kinase